jgi:TetR/AcrR family transcriptional regulator, transcriptional repressor for nem operon
VPRAKQFDEDAALSAAMRAFWSNGFEATSMSHLVEQMGINRASIYATFGDKQALFLRALKRYDRVHRQAWLTSLAAKNEPRGAIVAAFRDAIDSALAGGSDGCFLVNTALELSPHDETIRAVVADALRAAEDFFVVMLKSEGRDEALAPTLLTLFLGVRVLARSRPERPLLEGVLRQVEALLA